MAATASGTSARSVWTGVGPPPACLARTPRQQQRLADRQLLPEEPLAEALPVHERHHGVEEASGLAGIDEREDVRMLELGGDADLAEEALAGDGRHHARTHHLDGDLAAQLAIACLEDRRHPAPPRLALHDIAIAKRLFQHR